MWNLVIAQSPLKKPKGSDAECDFRRSAKKSADCLWLIKIEAPTGNGEHSLS